MSIIDIFTFKKQAEQVLSKANLESVLEIAREAIIEQAQNNYPGEEKKAKVDAQVIYAIQKKIEGCSNKLVVWLLRLLIKSIPSVTQKIYDLLKEKVENL